MLINTAQANDLDELKQFIDQQQYQKAVQLSNKLLTKHPNSVSSLFYGALANQKLKNFSKAESLYKKALTFDQYPVEINNNLANIYIHQQQFEKAAHALTQAINSNQQIATAYQNLVKIYSHLASKAYQQALNGETNIKSGRINPAVIASINSSENINSIPSAIVKKQDNDIQESVNSVRSLLNIKESVLDWAIDWQSKRYQDYINHYTDSYSPKNMSRQKWLTQREQRILGSDKINIKISKVKIKINENRATVEFDQSFASPTYKDKVRKRVRMINNKQQWLIYSEITLAVL